jgi:hypothetical protein
MAVTRAVVSYGEQVEVLATMDVGAMWDRYLGEFLGEWERLNRLGLPEAEVERSMQAFMDELSSKPLDDLARQSSSVSYNAGRSDEILRTFNEGEATFVVRSEILDNNTCPTCADLDGAVIEIGTPEYDLFLPPAHCDGGDRCRGFYVMIAGG